MRASSRALRPGASLQLLGHQVSSLTIHLLCSFPSVKWERWEDSECQRGRACPLVLHTGWSALLRSSQQPSREARTGTRGRARLPVQRSSHSIRCAATRPACGILAPSCGQALALVTATLPASSSQRPPKVQLASPSPCHSPDTAVH